MQLLAEQLSNARYVSLATRRRDGREVLTPVWMAPADGRHFVFSAIHSGKVKRLRREPQVRLAVCDWRGRVSSPWLPATAHLVTDDPQAIALACQALRRRYTWQMALLDLASRLAGRMDQRVIIEITF